MRFVLVLLALAAPAACTTGSLPDFAGSACTTSSDCGSGLTCVEYAAPGEGGCVSYGLTCVQPCTTTADCGGPSSGIACIASCGTPAICQPAFDAGTSVADSGKPDADAGPRDAAAEN